MNRIPNIKVDKGIPIISFDAMPFWEGVQKSAGVRKTLPFAVSAPIDGSIKQVTSTQITTGVVDSYLSDEYNFITPPPGSSEWANSLGKRSISTVESVVGKNYPKSILEIGGGSTWVASRLQELYNPETYTLVDPTVRTSSKGIKVIRDYFPNSQLGSQCFDLILGFSVLEHVPDPIHFLCNIAKHLTDKGKVILLYPNCEEQLLSGDLNVLLHEHLSYFTETSSRKLAAATGFDIISLNSKNDLFTLVLEKRREDTGEDFILDESGLLLESASMFQNLLTNTTNKIQACLDDGQRVGFHGATQGLNSFLYITALGSHPNIHLYDGDDSKKGLYLPACSTPIMSPQDKSYSSNSLLVISAMSFYEQIKQFAIGKAGFDPSQLLPLVGK